MQIVLDKAVDDYLVFADECTRGVRKSPPEVFDLVRDVDSLTRDVLRQSQEMSPLVWFLATNGYYMFLAATRTAISGHVSAIFPLLRLGLESACYGFLISKDESLFSIWSDRDKGAAQLAACRKTFTSAVKDTAKKLESVQIEMARFVSGLYDAAITFGAHPNPLSVFAHVQIREDDASKLWRVSYTAMYSAGTFEVRRALLACAEYGLAIAYLIAQMVERDAEVAALNVRFNAVNERKNNLEEKMTRGDA